VALPFETWIAYGEASISVGEDDLSLSEEELSGLLRGAQRPDNSTVEAMAKVTGGWPVIAQFFLRAAERSADLMRVTDVTKEVAFSYLAEQVLERLDSDHMNLLRVVAFAGVADVESLTMLGRDEPEMDIDWLRAAPVPLVHSPQGLRLHDLFAEYVRRSTPISVRRDLVDHVLDVLIQRRRIGEAVDLARAHAQGRLADLLSLYGFRLLEEGRWETAARAVMMVPLEARQSDPGVIGLRAALEASSGAVDRAESMYERAICLATDPDMRSSLSTRLSLIYINQGKDGAQRVLEPILQIGTERSRCDARSTYAVALAMAGNAADAVRELQGALAAAEELAEDALVARILTRLAWAYFHLGDAGISDRYAAKAVRLAESLGEWSIYASANSMLFACAAFYHDDDSKALRYAQQSVIGAARAGDKQKRAHGLWAQYHIAVECGRKDHVEFLERELESDTLGSIDSLMARYAQAVRLGWSGAFVDAVRTLETLDGVIVNLAQERYWRSALACFYAFAGKEAEAKAAISACGRRRPSANAVDFHYEVLADLHTALAEIFVGRSAVATRHVPSDCARDSDRALANCLKLLASQSTLNASSASEALQVLRLAGRDGFADLLLEALRRRSENVRVGSLTEAETAVLRGLAAGRSAKQIAETTGRSYETIRNQIKSACRKLGVSSQIELLAVARRLGILE
jgi:ATP/maltotriose-dependent transcriptional regulator MalT